MSAKLGLKNIAIDLRKQGNSYKDILKVIKVSKSSLSLWLKNVKLSEEQQSRLNTRPKIGQLLGAKASRDKRLLISKQIRNNAISEIEKINKNEMLMLGAMLYWGEGSKQSDRNVSQGVEFVNTDSRMCKFFIKWVTEVAGINIDSIIFRVYINASKKVDSNEYINIWSKIINISPEKIKIYFTKDRHSNLRRSNRDNYKGQLRIIVKKSTNLNRRIAGLVEGICLQTGVK